MQEPDWSERTPAQCNDLITSVPTGDAYMCAAGHDEDDRKVSKGTPIDRMIAMAKAMIDVVQNIPAPNGDKLQIRIVSPGMGLGLLRRPGRPRGRPGCPDVRCRLGVGGCSFDDLANTL
jgi:hypothetical protein